MNSESTFGSEPFQLHRLFEIGLDKSDLNAEKPPITEWDLLKEKPGSRIGPYLITQVLGEGGMGIVYLAQQEEPVRRQVALKVIKPGMDSKRVIARFEAEKQALALMQHPHIAGVYDAGLTLTGRPYFVMEYVKGIPIIDYCDHHKLMIEERLNLFVQVCQAVQHAHQKGIIHRDIKPSNILVSVENDRPIPKIIDFGVAKATGKSLTERTVATEDSQLLGTPEYMSPEQADMASEDIDTRSDVYSLGVLLYVLLTGVLPFEAEMLREGGIDHIRQVIRDSDPKTPSTRLTKLGEEANKVAEKRGIEVAALTKCLHRELEWIPLKAMRKERAERYRSASELADDIENYLKGTPLIAGPESTVYRVKKFMRRNRALVTSVASILIVLFAGIVVSTLFAIGQARARAEAQVVSDFLQFSVLESLDPFKVGGRQITIRSILDAASKDLEDKFHGTPMAEAEIRHTVGFAYWSLGLFELAELHYRRAVDICRAQRGDEHATTLLWVKELGWVLFSQSRFEEAEKLFSKALDGMQRLGVNERWHTMTSLAAVYFMQGHFQDAEKLSRDALDGVQLSRGKDPHVNFLLVMATGYRLQGRYSQAEELYRKGLEISSRELNMSNWYTLELKNNFGELYRLMGHYDKAKKLLNEAFVGRYDAWGPKHPDTLNTMALIGWLYYSQGQYGDAEVQFRNVLECAQEVLGNTHITVVNCIQGLGTVYLSQGRHDEANSLLVEALEMARRLLGEENWFTLRVKNTLARLYTARGRHDDADRLFREVLKGRQRALGNDHPETLETINDLAVLYKEQSRYEEAEPLLLEAVEGRRLKLGDIHPYTIESINNLIDLNETCNKPEKAKEWRSKLPQTEAVEE